MCYLFLCYLFLKSLSENWLIFLLLVETFLCYFFSYDLSGCLLIFLLICYPPTELSGLWNLKVLCSLICTLGAPGVTQLWRSLFGVFWDFFGASCKVGSFIFQRLWVVNVGAGSLTVIGLSPSPHEKVLKFQPTHLRVSLTWHLFTH